MTDAGLGDAVRALAQTLRRQIEETGRRDGPLGPMQTALLKGYVERFLGLHDDPTLRAVAAQIPDQPAVGDAILVLELMEHRLGAAAPVDPAAQRGPAASSRTTAVGASSTTPVRGTAAGQGSAPSGRRVGAGTPARAADTRSEGVPVVVSIWTVMMIIALLIWARSLMGLATVAFFWGAGLLLVFLAAQAFTPPSQKAACLEAAGGAGWIIVGGMLGRFGGYVQDAVSSGLRQNPYTAPNPLVGILWLFSLAGIVAGGWAAYRGIERIHDRWFTGTKVPAPVAGRTPESAARPGTQPPPGQTGPSGNPRLATQTSPMPGTRATSAGARTPTPERRDGSAPQEPAVAHSGSPVSRFERILLHQGRVALQEPVEANGLEPQGLATAGNFLETLRVITAAGNENGLTRAAVQKSIVYTVTLGLPAGIGNRPPGAVEYLRRRPDHAFTMDLDGAVRLLTLVLPPQPDAAESTLLADLVLASRGGDQKRPSEQAVNEIVSQLIAARPAVISAIAGAPQSVDLLSDAEGFATYLGARVLQGAQAATPLGGGPGAAAITAPRAPAR